MKRLLPNFCPPLAAFFVLMLVVPPISAQHAGRLITAEATTLLPVVEANDNLTPAGKVGSDGTLNVALEVVWSDFRLETPDRPGLRLLAIGEVGERPSIPAPLFRMQARTRVRVSVRNTLSDSSLTVFGFQERPVVAVDSLVIPPGEVVVHEFSAGVPGTYLYWMRIGAGFDFETDEREQLAGAFVVDDEELSVPDRILVMNIFSTPVDPAVLDGLYYEALTINGKSWPFTERLKPNVGEQQLWRIVNASNRNHPMHLHGFFYDIASMGDTYSVEHFPVEDQKTVVTQFMTPRTTMDMVWTPTRPGKWLFHCHLSFHVNKNLRLPGAQERDAPDEHVHMAGLVMGIEVAPGPSDLVYRGEDRHLTLYIDEYPTVDRARYAFSLDSMHKPDSVSGGSPGPPLILRQNQATYVTVENRMSVPTGIHWHGLEIDSWSDGVPGWSASDGKYSPVIEPGESFTYKLSSLRDGTFIYHSHLDDVPQLTGGLYGAIIVLPEGEEYDPRFDHIEILGWREIEPQRIVDIELNGSFEQRDQIVRVGETHRIRLINIAPAGNIFIRMSQGGQTQPLLALAKDGADFPENQRIYVDTGGRFGVGETADFVFAPTVPGAYTLTIGYGGDFVFSQNWIVHQ